MTRFPLTAVALSLVVAGAGPLFGLDRELVLGNEEQTPWAAATLNGLIAVPGRGGFHDLVREDARYEVGPDTQMLLHFDVSDVPDQSGRYRLIDGGGVASARERVFGTASTGFQPGVSGLTYEGPPLLGPADFTIELWLYPAHLSEGERILEWRADRWDGSRVTPQRLICDVEGRSLAWRLENLFFPVDGRLELQGRTPLVPRRWNHHMLRFSADTGLLEYLVDGIPEDVLYVTETGRDGSAVRLPLSDTPGRLTLGESYTGLIDELRVSHRFVEEPQLRPYPTTPGTATSKPQDLGYAGSRLLRIEATTTTPGRTEVRLFYRTGSSPLERHRERWSPWRAVTAGASLPSAEEGRYVQVRAELYPDGTHSPRLSDLRLVYEPDMPPPPPSLVMVEPGNRSLAVRWREVRQDDVAGYLVYYGSEPGRYDGTEALEGRSPVRVENANRLTLSGLENGKLYYVSVVTFDDSYPEHQSRFSREVAARPRVREASLE